MYLLIYMHKCPGLSGIPVSRVPKRSGSASRRQHFSFHPSVTVHVKNVVSQVVIDQRFGDLITVFWRYDMSATRKVRCRCPRQVPSLLVLLVFPGFFLVSCNANNAELGLKGGWVETR